MPTLPIAVEGRTVHVPCALPAEFQVVVCLSGHVVGFAVELSGRDPLTAKVADFDNHDGLSLTVDQIEKVFAVAEAAFSSILQRLGLDPVTRQPAPVVEESAHRVLALIAKAYEAEEQMLQSALEARNLLPGTGRPILRSSQMAEALLEHYTDSVVDAVQAEQEDRAEAERQGYEAAKQHASP